MSTGDADLFTLAWYILIGIGIPPYLNLVERLIGTGNEWLQCCGRGSRRDR